MSPISHDELIKGLKLIPLEDEGFAVYPDAGVLFHLNSTARQFLEYFQAGGSRDEIVRILANAGIVSELQVARDVESLLEKLKLEIEAALNIKRHLAPQLSAPLPEPVTYAIYRLFDRSILVHYPNQETAALCHPPMAPMAMPQTTKHDLEVKFQEIGRGYLVSCSLASVRIERTPLAALTALQRVILCHDRNDPGLFRIVLHAGAIVGSKGAWLIGGASGHGKSTLVSRLDAGGYKVLSDDLTPLELSEQRIFPMPMALSIKESGWSAVSAFRPDLTNVQSQRTTIGKHVRYLAPLNRLQDMDRCGHPIAGLLLPKRTAGAASSIKSVTLKQGMLALTDRFGRFPVEPDDLSGLIALVENVPRYEVIYDDVEHIMPELSKVL